MFVAYLIAAVVTVVVVRWTKKWLSWRALFNKMPGETDFKLFSGNLHKHPGVNEAGIVYDFENSKKYKYFHRMWFGPFMPVVVMYHPDVVKLVLKSQAPKPRYKWFASSYDMGVPWLGEGLINANGEQWNRNRRLLTPAFHFEILKNYLQVYNACADILLEKISNFVKQKKSFDIYKLLSAHALDIILRCAFSFKSDCQTNEENSYTKAIAGIQVMWTNRFMRPEFFNDFIYKLSADGKKFFHLCDQAHKVSEEIIEKRRKDLEKDPGPGSSKKMKDFLDILLSARDEDGRGLTPLEIRNEVDTFLFAGHDTTASGTTWTLYSLAQHPDCQDRVFDEISELLEGRQELEWNDLAKLDYTSMCIKEAVRYHSPVPAIDRCLEEDIQFQEYKIPAGTQVGINIFALHHNPHVWDEPNEYLPDRFHPDKQRQMNPFQFVPFSAGSRNCIGQNFAMNEMKATITKILRKYKLNLDPEHKTKRIPTVTVRPETGVYLYATPRE